MRRKKNEQYRTEQSVKSSISKEQTALTLVVIHSKAMCPHAYDKREKKHKLIRKLIHYINASPDSARKQSKHREKRHLIPFKH